MENTEWVLVLRDIDTHLVVEQSAAVIHETEEQSLDDLIEHFNRIMEIKEGENDDTDDVTD